MALATQCPHCNTTFRVAADQLKLRGGIVRCGACREVFDGNAALIDLDAPAAAPAPGAEPPPPVAEPAPLASEAFDAEVAHIEAQQAGDGEPVYTLDFDTTFDPFGVLPEAPQEAPEPESEAEPEPGDALPVDEEIEALPAPDQYEFSDAEDRLKGPDTVAAESTALLLTRQSAPGHDEVAPGAEPVASARPEPEPAEAESEEPEFVRRSRLEEESGRTRRMLMAAGVAVLALALVAQGVTTFRNVLAAQFPQLKPVLTATCALLGCRIELPAQIETLSIETGELRTLGGDTFLLTTLLRNQGSLTQAWPNIELALTDTEDKTLVRRVFTPAEYLPKGAAPAKGFGGRSEQPVKLTFELNQIKASGYHIAVFYP